MKKEDSKKLGIAFAVIVVFSVFISIVYGGGDGAPGEYDKTAQCLTEKGVKMYGAYWCPHCQNQKEEFGKSWDYIDYIECAVGTSNKQAKVCDDAEITGYPTWIFADGTRLSGEQTPNKLAETAGCEIQQQ